MIHLSITGLATAAKTSTATVMRFCQRVGCRGYQKFKIALAQEAIPPMPQLRADVSEDDSAADILRKVVAAAVEAVAGAATISLVAGSKETSYRLEAMASRLAHLAVLYALFVALAIRNRDRTLAAQESYGAVLSEHRF